MFLLSGNCVWWQQMCLQVSGAGGVGTRSPVVTAVPFSCGENVPEPCSHPLERHNAVNETQCSCPSGMWSRARVETELQLWQRQIPHPPSHSGNSRNVHLLVPLQFHPRLHLFSTRSVFQIPHESGIVQCSSFSVALVVLPGSPTGSSVLLRTARLCPFSWLSRVSVVCVCVCLCLCIHVHLFMPHLLYPALCCGHLGCSHVLTVVNDAAVNMGARVSLNPSFVFLGGHLEAEAGSHGGSMSCVGGPSTPFSTRLRRVVCPPTAPERCFSAPTPSPQPLFPAVFAAVAFLAGTRALSLRL